MKTRRVVAGAATVAALAGGAAGAIAASGTSHRADEDAVLADAAKRLGVTAKDLRDALGAAEDARLDQAVKAGRLTQEQADELKRRRRAGGGVLHVVPGGPGLERDGHGPWGPGRPGFGARFGHGPLDDVADVLGMTEEQLLERLRSGDSLADVAEAQGKTLDEVRAAVEAAVTRRLDAAVKDGRITRAQRDWELQELDEHLAHLGERPPRPGFGPPRRP